ncbi:MAG TPA: galactokinase family protein, partial [Gemmatimonadales bacterium]|nr:galactokinase family protein [Gemmatimonadales bacterium]
SSTATAATRAFAARFGDRAGTREWFVPGRIEVLGKHVDYAGGRSLLAAIDRGMHIVARPRRDARVHLADARSGQVFTTSLEAGLEPAPGSWTNYVLTVLRRMARDFGGTQLGMDAALASSLPSAAGISSSSALVISIFLPLASFNRLDRHAAWLPEFNEPGGLAGYLGAAENGLAYRGFPADFGVGTAGGSQDHLAILGCRTGRLTTARFLPTRIEHETDFPREWTFVVASSGVHASKTGSVQRHYNLLSADARAILKSWNDAHGGAETSLLDVLSRAGAEAELGSLLSVLPDAGRLSRRLSQFRSETLELIPAAVTAVARGDASALGSAIDRSWRIGAEVLANQTPETMHLAESARGLGALAASPFGAGFGGSVYAIVEREAADDFAARWMETYRHHFRDAGARSEVFRTDPADGAHETTGSGDH